jgi:Protein kinase domain
MSEQFAGEKGTYESSNTLGDPGLYGQAYLCWDTVNKREVVVKVLHAKAPADGHEAMEREARVLDKVATSEKAANVQYAVRLLDKGVDENGRLRFIVLERATGQNVQDDIIGVGSGPDEQTVLEIALQFCVALTHVHQAGYTYDDMKLQNLFWTRENRQKSPLRIIDWNVVREIAGREKAIAGDWARFGARLYELYTGQRIGLSREGIVVGPGPSGPRWDALPAGVKDVITRALDRGYDQDAQMQRDMKREYDQFILERGNKWQDLIDKAVLAENDPQADPILILAPISRAERLFNRLPQGQRDETARQQIAELRATGEARQGRAPERLLQSGIKLLTDNDFVQAEIAFKKANDAARKRDPRPRRYLWLTQLALENNEIYRLFRDDLEKAVELLNQEHYDAANDRLELLKDRAEVPQYRWLVMETAIRTDVAAGKRAEVITRSTTFEMQEFLKAWPDLRAYVDDLIRRQATDEARRQAEEQDSSARKRAEQSLIEARRVERSHDLVSAITHYSKAERALSEISEPDEGHRHWLRFHIQHLRAQLDMRDLIKDAGRLDKRDEAILDTFVTRAQKVLPELSPVFEIQHLRAQSDMRNLKAEVIRLMATTGVSPEVIKSDVSQIVPELIPVFDMLIQHGQSQAEAEQESVQESIRKATETLTEKIAKIGGMQRRNMEISAQIDNLNKLIEAGILGEASSMLTSLREKFSGYEETLLAGQKEGVERYRALIIDGGIAINKAEKQIRKRRKSAGLSIEDYCQALNEKNWNAVATAFKAAITLECDERTHYASLDDLYSIVTKYLNTVVYQQPSSTTQRSSMFTSSQPKQTSPQLTLQPLLDVASQEGPLVSMLKDVAKVMYRVWQNTDLPEDIQNIGRQHSDRLAKMVAFLSALDNFKSATKEARQTQMVITQFENLDDRDKEQLNMVRKTLVSLNSYNK